MEQRFQVNLRGVIDLLSHHLYSSPDVFVRELLQNGTDAIRARQKLEPGHAGTVRILADPHQVVFEDDGIGLTEDEIHRLLATVGESSKREALAARRSDFIGQFGIGLLSCFMVSDEILVRTRSLNGGGKTWEWRGRHDGTYAITEAAKPLAAPGTVVTLTIRPTNAVDASPERVQELANRYGGMLPFPILFGPGPDARRINPDPLPWRREFDSPRERREALLSLGRSWFEVEPLDVVPLKSAAGEIDGVAFVLPFTPHFGTRQKHRVYLKQMLLSEGAEELLPDWAFFVRCVVNSNALRPTASREDFYQDETLEKAKQELGASLRRYLMALQKESPALLQRLINLHAMSMRALALDDDDFFKMIAPHLPFETSLGVMRLEELARNGSAIRYTATVDAFRQVARVAAAQGTCVVNAGHAYEAELLEKLGHLNDTVEVGAFTASDLPQSFEELSVAERKTTATLLRAATAALAPFGCEVSIKRFLPADLPALYALDDAGSFARDLDRTREEADDLYGSLLDGLNPEAAGQEPPRLFLNASNPLVQRLIELSEPKLLKTLVETLYVQALLLGQRPLRATEMALLNRGLLSLISAVVDASRETMH